MPKVNWVVDEEEEEERKEGELGREIPFQRN